MNGGQRRVSEHALVKIGTQFARFALVPRVHCNVDVEPVSKKTQIQRSVTRVACKRLVSAPAVVCLARCHQRTKICRVVVLAILVVVPTNAAGTLPQLLLFECLKMSFHFLAHDFNSFALIKFIAPCPSQALVQHCKDAISVLGRVKNDSSLAWLAKHGLSQQLNHFSLCRTFLDRRQRQLRSVQFPNNDATTVRSQRKQNLLWVVNLRIPGLDTCVIFQFIFWDDQLEGCAPVDFKLCAQFNRSGAKAEPAWFAQPASVPTLGWLSACERVVVNAAVENCSGTMPNVVFSCAGWIRWRLQRPRHRRWL